MARDFPEKQPGTRRDDQELTADDFNANDDLRAFPEAYQMLRDGDEAEGWLLLQTRELNEIWRDYEETGRERRQPERERRAA